MQDKEIYKYSLTPSEVQLGRCLLQGDSLRRAAGTMGITYETARDKLKTIYQKTGVNKQTQLVLLLERTGIAKDIAQNQQMK